MMRSLALAMLCFVLCLFSCKISEKIQPKIDILSIKNEICDGNRKIDFFLTARAGEAMPLSYEKLAIISTANGNNPKDKPLHRLKMAATRMCADGILEVRRTDSKGQYQTMDVISDWDGDTRRVEKYPIFTYTAYAVKLKNYDSLHLLKSDSIFVDQWNASKRPKVSSRCEECSLKRNPKGFIYGLVGVSAVFGLFVLMMKL